jgi:hypothetical protein
MPMKGLRLPLARVSPPALLVAVFAWAAGCATQPRPMVDPYFAARTYTPSRIAVMPPDVFVVYDEVGDNDPRKSAELGRQVGDHLARLLIEGLSRRGYAVDTSTRWDGVHAPDGTVVVGGQDLSWMAGSILQFSASPAGAVEGPMKGPAFVAPELAQKLGSATGADALLYLNLKGAAVSPGKRTAQVLGVVFFVVVIAAIILLLLANNKGGNSRGGTPAGGGGSGASAVRAAPAGSAMSAVPAAGTPARAHFAPRGYGRLPPGGGGPVYGGSHVNFGVGLGVMVPLDGPVATHEGAVADDDSAFAGNQAYLTMSLVSTYDGRVLWHLRQSIDVDLDDPKDVDRVVARILDAIPPSLARPGERQPPAVPVSTTAAPPPPPPPPPVSQ